jgi:hypothetical protein
MVILCCVAQKADSVLQSYPAGSLSSIQPSGPPCWASLLAFGLIAQVSLNYFSKWKIVQKIIFPDTVIVIFKIIFDNKLTVEAEFDQNLLKRPAGSKDR